jgi:hypothetical protein
MYTEQQKRLKLERQEAERKRQQALDDEIAKMPIELQRMKQKEMLYHQLRAEEQQQKLE